MNKTVLEFSVSGQTMTQIDGTKVVRDMSRDYLRLRFDFDETWDGMIKTVYFQTADSAYPQLMETNEVDVPDYYAQLESFLITVVGINGSTAVATNVLSIALDAAGSIWVKVPSEPPTPVYQELVNLAESAAQAAKESADTLASMSTELNSIGQNVDTLSRDMVRKVNNVIPGSDGNVTVSAEHIDTQQDEWAFQGTVDAALDELCAMLKGKVSEESVKSLVAESMSNYATASDVNAAIVNALTNYVTAQVLTDTLTEALADYATADQLAELPKKVNSIGPDAEGNVEITSDSIPMGDGEGGWGGFVLTDVIDELNQGIAAAPTESKINQLIDAKLAELPAGGETDVQINGTSIVQGGVANIPLSGSLEYADGYLRVRQTTVENITQRVATRALTLDKLDAAVKAVLCDGAGAAWTAEEQAAARARLGILTTEGVTF